MPKDRIFKDIPVESGSFQFNEAVAAVFPDMLERSVPGYAGTLAAIGTLASRYVQPGSRCYDLGCSLGAATLAMRRHIRVPDCEIVAVDLAEAMVRRCREAMAGFAGEVPVTVQQADVRDVEITNASMVVLNYTLQFVPVEDRDTLIRRIHAGMRPGGVFVLSEKVADEDEAIDSLLIELHHEFKRRNAYSELEISRKRTAIENVLVPETVADHLARLRAAGFTHAGTWLRQFNFVSFVAIC